MIKSISSNSVLNVDDESSIIIIKPSLAANMNGGKSVQQTESKTIKEEEEEEEEKEPSLACEDYVSDASLFSATKESDTIDINLDYHNDTSQIVHDKWDSGNFIITK